MKRNLRGTLLLGLCMLGSMQLACDKQSNSPTTGTPAGPTNGPAQAATQATAPSTAPAPEPAPATAPAAAVVPADSLPRAKGLLPEGELSGDVSLAVIGDGYRFQVKPGFKPVPHPVAGTAYTGSFDMGLGMATMTVFVTHEPFTGDLDALAKRQTDAARAAGAKIEIEGPVKVLTEGHYSDVGYRFLSIEKDVLDEQVVTVHDGTAWVFHSQTPNVPNAVAFVGADLAISGSTFHVAPPK